MNLNRIILILLSLSLVVLSSELFLRLIHYPFNGCKKIQELPENKFIKYDKELGWIYKAGINISMEPLDLYPGIKIITSEDAFRSSDQHLKVDYFKQRILFIGDSITFGHGINYNNTFSAQLEKLFENNIQMINLGVQGYGTDQAFLYLQRAIKKYKPMAVVFLYAWDQPERNNNYNRNDYFKCSKVIATKPRFTIRGNKLHLINRPKLIEIKGSRLLVFFTRLIEKIKKTLLDRQKYEITRQLLTEIKKLGSDNSADTFFLNYQSQMIGSLNDWYPGDEFFILNLDEYLPSDPIYWVNPKDSHPNELAHKKIAKIFYDKYNGFLKNKIAP